MSFTQSGIKLVNDAGFKLLGASIGSTVFADRLLNERIDKVIDLLSKLTH